PEVLHPAVGGRRAPCHGGGAGAARSALPRHRRRPRTQAGAALRRVQRAASAGVSELPGAVDPARRLGRATPRGALGDVVDAGAGRARPGASADPGARRRGRPGAHRQHVRIRSRQGRVRSRPRGAGAGAAALTWYLRAMGKKPPLPPWLEHAALVKKKMKERGFKMADRVQICERCEEYAEETWTLKGGQGMGGRDICACMNCGRARSWKGQGPARTVEEPFDL